MSAPIQNTDRELFREDTGEPAGSYYENHVFVTTDQHIGMGVGGLVYVMPISDWHELAKKEHPPPSLGRGPNDVELVEATTPTESADIACREIRKALKELDTMPASHEADHVRMWLNSALIWLRRS